MTTRQVLSLAEVYRRHLLYASKPGLIGLELDIGQAAAASMRSRYRLAYPAVEYWLNIIEANLAGEITEDW